MLSGIVNLAPESLPVKVNIVFKVFEVPNKVLTVVAVILIVVPITVLDTFVPTVEVEFNVAASVVFTPVPWKTDNTLESPIVAVYPDASNDVSAPK